MHTWVGGKGLAVGEGIGGGVGQTAKQGKHIVEKRGLDKGTNE